jgi:uncharacterized protein YndB with AHSA1/START domain
MAQAESDILEHEIWIAASRETVFAYFIDPARLTRWMGIRADLDPRPGGVYRVDINGKDIARGEFLEVTPHSRIVFTWGWEGSPLPPGSTTVEVTFTAEGEYTVVRLRHNGLPPDQAPIHISGWEHYLARLALTAAGGQAGPDPWAAQMMGR